MPETSCGYLTLLEWNPASAPTFAASRCVQVEGLLLHMTPQHLMGCRNIIHASVLVLLSTSRVEVPSLKVLLSMIFGSATIAVRHSSACFLHCGRPGAGNPSRHGCRQPSCGVSSGKCTRWATHATVAATARHSLGRRPRYPCSPAAIRLPSSKWAVGGAMLPLRTTYFHR